MKLRRLTYATMAFALTTVALAASGTIPLWLTAILTLVLMYSIYTIGARAHD